MLRRSARIAIDGAFGPKWFAAPLVIGDVMRENAAAALYTIYFVKNPLDCIISTRSHKYTHHSATRQRILYVISHIIVQSAPGLLSAINTGRYSIVRGRDVTIIVCDHVIIL